MPPPFVNRPAFRIDGQLRQALGDGLVELTIAEDVDGLSQCEAVFSNWGARDGGAGFLFFDRTLLEFGKSFTVEYGSPARSLFAGRILAIEGRFPAGAAPAIAVRAADRLADLRMTRRTRTFQDMADADVMRQIAGNHGLTPHIDVTGETHKTLAQVNQSDFAFLLARARAVGAELWVEGDALHARMRTDRGGTIDLAHGGTLRSFTVAADLTGQRTRVTVAGWDPAAKAPIAGAATRSAVSGELDGGHSGAELLEQALGARDETIVHAVPHSGGDAQRQADAAFRRGARRFVIGRGVAETDTGIRAGSPVRLSGLGPLFSVRYYVTEARHRFDGQHGLRTEFTAESAGLGRP